MGAQYHLDYAAFGELVLNADWMEAEMRSRAERAAELARSIAPVDQDGPHPGRYRNSIRAESGKHGGYHDDRAYGRVVADAPEAVFVEFGTEHNPAHHTLTTAMDALR